GSPFFRPYEYGNRNDRGGTGGRRSIFPVHNCNGEAAFGRDRMSAQHGGSMIAIEAIKFNHQSNSAASDALNVRRNGTQFTSVPEWRRFISVNPEDSRAVYAVAPASGNTVTIAVSLSSTYAGSAFLEVRVRGHVKARPVNFINGTAGFVFFEL